MLSTIGSHMAAAFVPNSGGKLYGYSCVGFYAEDYTHLHLAFAFNRTLGGRPWGWFYRDLRNGWPDIGWTQCRDSLPLWMHSRSAPEGLARKGLVLWLRKALLPALEARVAASDEEYAGVALHILMLHGWLPTEEERIGL